MGDITFVLSWASKARQHDDCCLGVYLSLVALMTTELSDTIKEEPASYIAKTFRNPHVLPRSEPLSHLGFPWVLYSGSNNQKDGFRSDLC